MFARFNYVVYMYSKLYNYSLASYFVQDAFSTHGHSVIYIISRAP